MIYSKNSLIPLNVTRPCISTRPPNCYCSLWQKTPFYMPFLPDEKVHIHVSIRENGDCLLLSVQDISKGMSPETLEILRKQINAPRQPDKQDSGYGLYNVNERIRIFYGPDFGLNIDSDPDIGTEITLKIPKLERGEPYVPSNPV